MTRRRIIARPTSRLAVWSLRVAGFALAATFLAVVIVRLDFLEALPGLAVLGGALFMAVVAILLAFGAFVIIWNEGTGGLRLAVAAFFLGIAVLAYPAYLGIKGYRLPPLNDVTTDMEDPPRFEVITRLRPRDANPIAYPGAAAATLQRANYPDLEPLVVNTTPKELYEAAIAVITKRKWRVVDARQPEERRADRPARDGRIEAVVRTPIMGFRDDVVVRVRAGQGGARLDARSASRYGVYDFGNNAQRVRSLVDDIDETLGSQPPAKR